MSGKLRAYVAKLSQMDAERLAGHDCMFARRLEDLRKFQAEVEPAIAEAMTAAFEAGTDDPLTFMGEHMLRSKAKPKSEPAEDSRKRRATLDASAPLAPALKTINLFQNQIGDEGARRLADALAAASAAPALKKLELSSNPASDDAKQAVKDAVNQRKPTE